MFPSEAELYFVYRVHGNDDTSFLTYLHNTYRGEIRTFADTGEDGHPYVIIYRRGINGFQIRYLSLHPFGYANKTSHFFNSPQDTYM